MNLKEWLNYRKNCPICQAPLTTYLHSSKKQGIKWEDGRMVIVFPLYSLDKKKTSDYKVGYSFHLTENQFCIEFYTKEGLRIEKDTQFHLINRFKSLNENLKNYKFYRQCNGCKRYQYSSDIFKFNFKTFSLDFEENFIVSSEYLGLIQTMKTGSKTPFRIYRLDNFYAKIEMGTCLTYWNSLYPHGILSDCAVPDNARYVILPLIPFISEEDTLNRIKKLLVFL
jgi:hypothetical protein